MPRESASSRAGTRSRNGDELILLIGVARSGTTLLRLLLDAHPEIGCPGEAGIPSLIHHLGRVWWTITTGADTASRFADLPEQAKRETRRAARVPMRYYCSQEGKRIYCDKSLDSAHHLELVRELFPTARYVLLFRHVMDTVASGLESSPWGFDAYGYLPFVQRSPENFVTALVDYWLAHVEKALKWEEDHAELCHRVRYEDLVTAPEEVLGRLFRFLGVVPDLSVLQAAFEKGRAAAGPGDHKVMYTSGIEAGSVGRGKAVPIAMIPAPQLEAVNAALAALGYEPLTTAWNAEPVAQTSNDGGPWAARLLELMRGAKSASRDGRDEVTRSFAVVANDAKQLRWVVDPAAGVIRQGDGEVESVVTGAAQDLVLLLSGQANPGVLLRSGRIRLLNGREGVSREELTQTLRSALDVLMPARAPTNGSESSALAL